MKIQNGVQINSVDSLTISVHFCLSISVMFTYLVTCGNDSFSSQFMFYSQPMQEPDAYPPVDYPKVKEDLAYGPNKRKALLLQAIRWVRIGI